MYNPDPWGNIFDRLLMAKVQSVNRKAYFSLVGDEKAYLEEWLRSSTTTAQGRAVFDFESSLGCEQMVTEPTHIGGGVLDLVLTDVHDLLRFGLGRQLGPEVIVLFSCILGLSNLFLTWCVRARDLLKVWTESSLEM